MIPLDTPADAAQILSEQAASIRKKIEDVFCSYGSILLFLPSTMLSGIIFPIDMLPKAFVMAGKLFPATWGYAFMTESAFTWHNFRPLLVIFLLAVLLCAILLKKIETR